MSNQLKGMTPDVRRVVEFALSKGYIMKAGKKHLKLIPPDKSQAIVTVGISNSDFRAHKNLRSLLRRQGLAV